MFSFQSFGLGNTKLLHDTNAGRFLSTFSKGQEKPFGSLPFFFWLRAFLTDYQTIASKIKNSIKPLVMQQISKKVDINEIELDFILEYILSAMIAIVSYWFRMNKVLPAEDLILIMYQLMDNKIINKLTQQK